MLELFGSGLISLWLDMAGVKLKPMQAFDTLAWQTGTNLVLAPDPNPARVNTVREYLKQLQALKLIKPEQTQVQGIWMQSGPMLMANHQGTKPLPAASLTKIATSLVALKHWGHDHKFETLINATGPIKNGVLEGNLVVNASGDPLFVWEEAITIANTLNKMGIKRVNGNLVIVGKFAMNFQRNPQLAGQALKRAFNFATWSRRIAFQHSRMPKGTPKPQIVITGKVEVKDKVEMSQTKLIRHRSLPMAQLINEMNVFSNNEMAEMLAESVGGASVVQSTAAKLARVPSKEIQLINGSGLGQENRISPRAATAMLMAIQRLATPHNLTVADFFPTSGLDHRGTTYARRIPKNTAFKTGTLRDVSALAGVMPTKNRGLVWFAVINKGVYVPGFRSEQDKLLQKMLKDLQEPATASTAVSPTEGKKAIPELGKASRNDVLYKS
ncbi:D-alanyl-D-alanine carboxypeptidase (penicillin-binding protein 4) [Rivularia sp. PCC 7116]|uniref:D-alanyl-D-alanine carboxypeptidase n=1 Tax=Rivularia sp. PCC 7116 TaxID=373994 RepID=UPI00029EDD9E|nr:D-alanyl-D-alanine carboxypeptidase [Rivularia sp. PCC 7116]AFY52717.1 D-alanyl-D-alanine carboxypeptidase (penicillin-binding protein 4) [Rivularia sp. PCC 7116]